MDCLFRWKFVDSHLGFMPVSHRAPWPRRPLRGSPDFAREDQAAGSTLMFTHSRDACWGAVADSGWSPAPCGWAWLRSCDRSAGHGLPMGSIRGVDGLGMGGLPGNIWGVDTGRSVYTLRQASRCPWRMRRRRPVQVVFVA